LFWQQDIAYRNSVLPQDVPVFGLTSGLPIALQRMTGREGRVFGVEQFSGSAPYPVLEEKLGFTVENIYKEVGKML
jgi:transketolase